MATIPADFRHAFVEAICEPSSESPAAPQLAAAWNRSPPVDDSAVPPAALESLLSFTAVLARCAFCEPGPTLPVLDHLAESWLDGTFLQADALTLPTGTSSNWSEARPLAEGFEAALFNLLEADLSAETITPAIAALAGLYPPKYRDALARAMSHHDGVGEFLEKPEMPRTTLDRVADCAPGTLGRAFHDLIVDNGFDLEVLDPDSVHGYHADLDRVNRRILQTHEIWHLVAGYSTSPLHEVAISGFQLAQFGHPYSRDFLATIMLLILLKMPAVAPIVLQAALEGWRHGRNTQALLLVNWHERWDDSIEGLRAELGIQTYQSAIPDAVSAS